ncbi:hypothetical protein [Allobranchiibius sp. CTAmp26]|uniref:hypothetical protein n=1 Tax=Allobranchiibius sp. CTAmp26 TaxID=2815214 RepID=UPI001AA0BDC6|nr:hypothetical protein [Allobranchiibius sp. CTAmp26]MBO1755577.1 hypothetical protein [Allobranchiibius sp. CTAmp26]
MPQLRRRGSHVPLPAPVAARLQKPSWRDGRLVAGVLLVLLAMLGGAAALAHFDSTVEMLQASHTLVPGQTIGRDDVTSVKVRMDGRHAGYLKADDGLPRGQVVRAVQSGELVPASAVGDGSSLHEKTIALPATTGQSSILVAGSIVDLYVSAKQTAATGDTGYQDPRLLISGVLVARISRPSTGLGAGTADDSVQVQIPDAQVPAVLAAVNKGAKVDLVPAAGSPVQGGS